MNLIEQAMMMATHTHVLDNRQLYGKLLPYTHHLAAVEQVLIRFGFTDEEIRTAAWLHDIIEDTRDKPNKVKRRDIEEGFGDDVAALVWAVTSEEGENRTVRNRATYPKIRAAGYRAVALKLADRIANVEYGGRSAVNYKKEHPEFQHGIYILQRALPDDQDRDDLAVDMSPEARERRDLLKIGEMQRHLDGLLR